MQTKKHSIGKVRSWSVTPSLHTLTLLAALGFASNAHAAVRYSVTDLGTLGGISYNFLPIDYYINIPDVSATGINNAGQVVGWSETANGARHAFVTVNGVMTDLGTFGGMESFAEGINDAGQVVGYSRTASGEHHAFVTVNGVMTDLGTLGGDYSTATDINNAGQVVGFATIPNPYGEPSYFDQPHAFVMVNGVMTDLGTLGGSNSYAYGINDVGQVVGWSETAGGETHAFVTVNGVMTDLGTFGGMESFAEGINDAGQVVGESLTASGARHAFVTVNGVMTDLGTLGGGYSEANAINDAGQVVGNSLIADGDWHAFVTVNGVMTDLNSLLDPADAAVWTLTNAKAINDAGQIVANALIIDINGRLRHAVVLLTPVVVPIPAAI